MGIRVSATPQHLHGIRGIDGLEPTLRVPHDCGGQIPIEVGKPCIVAELDEAEVGEPTCSLRTSSTMALVLDLTNAVTKSGEPMGTPTHVIPFTWMTLLS